MFNDPTAEFRLLSAFVDTPKEILSVNEELFTGDRVRLFRAMKSCYLYYEGTVSSEGIEKYYQAPLPPELEMARGAKPKPLIERLTHFATRRQLVQVSNDLSILINMPEINREEISRALHMKAITVNEDSSVVPGISGFVADFAAKKSGKYRFVDTGMSFLNMMLGGEWPRQGMSIILGAPGGGKTALVCQSVLNMARAGIPVLFVSLEMPKAKLISRFVANMSDIDGLKLRSGKVDEPDLPRIDAALYELQQLPIYIIDNPEMTVDEIVYQVRLHKELHGIEAFFVDYLQIVTMSSRGNDNLVEELGYITQRLRNVAKVEELSAILLAQQNRQYKGIQSVMGSGRPGQIADTMIEIRLEDEATNDDQRTCTLDFHKNRDGPVGAATCLYRPRYLRFE